jgi:hypothetical protein
MKKILVGVLAFGSLLLFVSGAKAALTQDLTITVTPNGTKSVSLSGATLDFGTLNLASTNNISSSVTVTNDGNVPEAFGLRIKTADGVWASGSSAAPNVYNLRALFNSSLPVAGDFLVNDDVLTQGSAVVATGAGLIYSGNQDASVVDPATDRGLWFKLDMPTTTTIMSQRSFVVEVSAN